MLSSGLTGTSGFHVRLFCFFSWCDLERCRGIASYCVTQTRSNLENRGTPDTYKGGGGGVLIARLVLYRCIDHGSARRGCFCPTDVLTFVGRLFVVLARGCLAGLMFFFLVSGSARHGRCLLDAMKSLILSCTGVIDEDEFCQRMA